MEAQAPTVTVTLDAREADMLMEAVNVAIKAAPNAIEASMALNPVAVKIAQARQAAMQADASPAPKAA
jgi:hypothetical protein